MGEDSKGSLSRCKHFLCIRMIMLKRCVNSGLIILERLILFFAPKKSRGFANPAIYFELLKRVRIIRNVK